MSLSEEQIQDLSLLTQKYVPAHGKAKTIAGEILRACMRLHHDFYNNGCGNNTSGAINYLKYNNILDKKTFQIVYEYSRGRIYEGRYTNDGVHRAFDAMTCQVYHYVKMYELELSTTKSLCDMFEFEESDLF